jgi:hypothetical protein
MNQYFIKTALFCILYILISGSHAVGEIKNCHDYTLYQLTKRLPEKTHNGEWLSVNALRDWLGKHHFTRHYYPAGTDWRVVDGWLAQYDVIIIGNAHSGIVGEASPGRLMFFNFTRKTKNYDAKLHRDPSLSSRMYAKRKEHPQYPYKSMSVELWRYLRSDN